MKGFINYIRKHVLTININVRLNKIKQQHKKIVKQKSKNSTEQNIQVYNETIIIIYYYAKQIIKLMSRIYDNSKL